MEEESSVHDHSQCRSGPRLNPTAGSRRIGTGDDRGTKLVARPLSSEHRDPWLRSTVTSLVLSLVPDRSNPDADEDNIMRMGQQGLTLFRAIQAELPDPQLINYLDPNWCSSSGSGSGFAFTNPVSLNNRPPTVTPSTQPQGLNLLGLIQLMYELTPWQAVWDGYCKANKLKDAHELLAAMPERNMVSWNTSVPTRLTFASVLSAYGALMDIDGSISLLRILGICARGRMGKFGFTSGTSGFPSCSHDQQIHDLIV
ncbi:hypothetical protein U1Q18_022800 [Sarracenia purpurea var. burkii]